MSDNDLVVEAWNTVQFQKFVRFKHLLIAGLAGHSDELLSRRQYHRGVRVLDVGCGFGDCTLKIANAVGPTGAAFGVDCAENFVREGERAADAAGIHNATFFRADVQSDDLRGPYDHAFARFGTMFFVMPGAALRNIRIALKPGGVLTQVVWRRREDNPWLYEAELKVREIVPVVSHEGTNQVHCGPGPFSISGPDMVSTMLLAAGYAGIAFERFDADRPPSGRRRRIRLGAWTGRRNHPTCRRRRREATTAGGRGIARYAGSLCAQRRHLGAIEHLVHHRP
jgi:ubiquinone/menaquinone biosynthesis C-methylase UbiE